MGQVWAVQDLPNPDPFNIIGTRPDTRLPAGSKSLFPYPPHLFTGPNPITGPNPMIIITLQTQKSREKFKRQI